MADTHPKTVSSPAPATAPGADNHAEPEDTSKGQPVEQRQVHAVHEVKAPPPPEPEEEGASHSGAKPAAKPSAAPHK